MKMLTIYLKNFCPKKVKLVVINISSWKFVFLRNKKKKDRGLIKDYIRSSVCCFQKFQNKFGGII